MRLDWDGDGILSWIDIYEPIHWLALLLAAAAAAAAVSECLDKFYRYQLNVYGRKVACHIINYM